MRRRCVGVGVSLGVLLWLVVLSGTALGSFGFKSFSYSATNVDGSPDVQAASHPWALTTSFSLNVTTDLGGEPTPDGDVKDTDVNTPLGLVGNPSATAKCSIQQFTTPPNKEKLGNPNSSYLFSGATCPNDSQVGVAAVSLGEGGMEYIGVYNLVPPPGVPAEFGFNYVGEPVLLTASLREDGSYGLTVHARDISQTLHVFGASVTFWGVPADPRHDGIRGECLGNGGNPVEIPGGCHAESNPVPFLTLPTSCPEEPPVMSIRADPWQDPGVFVGTASANLDSHGNPVGISGCERLDFSPALTIAPDTSEANAPTGFEADLKLPQSENPNGLAESHLRAATVTLPEGMVVNPSAADGREACTPAQIDLNAQTPAACPDSSKIGEVTVTTPLLEKPLEGAVYLAQQENNPFGTLLAIYVAVEGDGVHAKLAARVQANPTSGQLTTTFDGNRLYGVGSPLEGEPQLPFSELRFRFFGGPRAALTTPGCGEYAANASFTPWSGTSDVVPAIAPFRIGANCGGGFAPSFAAGTENSQAAGFSPFVTSISRGGQDQRIGQVSVKVPQGLLGMISRVSLCDDAHAAVGTCPVASQIGHLNVSAGAGANPISLPQAGRQEDPVYLTGPYKGAPFGLALVAHPEAGPFNLGPPIVVRAGIYVDPHTAQITVVTDSLPTIVKGIPLNLRTATVTIDRAGTASNQFTFNPTSCAPQAVTGTVVSTQGVAAGVSDGFQAVNCAALPFKPAFKVSTYGGTSKKLGASLDVKVTSSPGQANIAKVKVTLPKQLPARLTTLQKACTEAAFAANPATCPVQSNVGFAKAVSPVLNVPLEGPAYLVSHGGAAFPDLVVVLQGENIRLDLVGNTNIVKGVTTSTFNTLPDAPISSFELKLPQGTHSALTSNLPVSAKGGFCATKLTLPIVATAQSGAQITSSVRIGVSGCPKVRGRARRRRSARRSA